MIQYIKSLPWKMFFISGLIQLTALTVADYFGLHGLAKFLFGTFFFISSYVGQIWWKIKEPRAQYYSDD